MSQLVTKRTGGPGNDEFIAVGKSGPVKFLGGGGDDFLQGGKGKDYLDGQAGDDRVNGGAGNDKVKGGSGNDLLLGGKGDDKLSGGPGHDTYVFAPDFGHDIVKNFKHGHDTLNLVEVLREDGSVRIDFSDLKISYDHEHHEATIRVPGAGTIEVHDFHGKLHESDFDL